MLKKHSKTYNLTTVFFYHCDTARKDITYKLCYRVTTSYEFRNHKRKPIDIYYHSKSFDFSYFE